MTSATDLANDTKTLFPRLLKEYTVAIRLGPYEACNVNFLAMNYERACIEAVKLAKKMQGAVGQVQVILW